MAKIKDATIRVYDAASQAFIKIFPKTSTSQIVDFATAVAAALDPYIKSADVNAALANKLDKSGTAIKATADASGNVITTTYQTIANSNANLSAARLYADKYKTGETIAKKAEQDASGNVISDTYATKDEMSKIPKFAIEVVSTLPTANVSETTVYLVKTGNDSENMYTEYIYIGGSWEELGTQSLDMSGYMKKADADAKYQTKLTFDNMPTANSQNPVKSGGVKTAIDDAVTAHNTSDTAHANLFFVSESAMKPQSMSNNGIWFEVTGDSTIVDADDKAY